LEAICNLLWVFYFDRRARAERADRQALQVDPRITLQKLPRAENGVLVREHVRPDVAERRFEFVFDRVVERLNDRFPASAPQ
jgi:hypothetical protein